MTTPINTAPFYFDWYLAGQGGTDLYQTPKVANLQDVEDYTTHANEYVVVNGTGTGWTYSPSTGAPPTTFASLNDVSWGNTGAGFEAGAFVVVNPTADGLEYRSQAQVFSEINNFYSLGDVIDYRTGNFGDRLVVVDSNSVGITYTPFGISPLDNVAVNSNSTMCYWYTISGTNYYCVRPKSRFTFTIDTDQSSIFAGNNSGYDTNNVMYSRNMYALNSYPFQPLAFGSFYTGGPNNIIVDQNEIINSTNLWTYDPITAKITLTDFNASSRAGQQPLLSGHSFRVTINAYLQFHLNPNMTNFGTVANIGVQKIGGISGLPEGLPVYDTTTLTGVKPGPSNKLSRTFITTLDQGDSLQPVFRLLFLGTNQFAEIDFVSVNIIIEEI